MSASLNGAAMPFMIGLSRVPDLNSVSCLARYSGCWPCRIGLAGLPREPSLVWQAAQTSADLAWPFARSGLAAAAACSCAEALAADAASRRPHSRRAADFMSDVGFSGAKPGDF